MEELAGLIAALIEAFRARNSPSTPAGRTPSGNRWLGVPTSASNRPPAAQARETGAAPASADGGSARPAGGAGGSTDGLRTAAAGGGNPRVKGVANAAARFSVRSGPPVPGFSGPGLAGPGDAGSARAEAGSARAEAGSARAEAGLVTGLFASPQSLVAAFIVSEVLGRPVALRPPDTGRAASAL